MIEIKKSKCADTRTCDWSKVSKEELTEKCKCGGCESIKSHLDEKFHKDVDDRDLSHTNILLCQIIDLLRGNGEAKFPYTKLAIRDLRNE